MSRFIDADMVEYFKTFNPDKGKETIADMAWRSDIDAVPTVDVVEVVHGKWIELYENNYKCSVCGDWWETIEGTPQDNGMSFCPHCGAKMEVTK